MARIELVGCSRVREYLACNGLNAVQCCWMSDLLTLCMARNVTSVDASNLVRSIIREVPLL